MNNFDATFSQNSVVLLTQDIFEEEKEKRSMMTLFYTDSTLTKLWSAIASQTPGPLFSAVKQMKTDETSETLILVCREGVPPKKYCGEITFNAIAEYALKEFY